MADALERQEGTESNVREESHVSTEVRAVLVA